MPVGMMGLCGEAGGPGNVAVAGRVEGVPAFAEDPAGALVSFAQREEVGGDVLFGPGEPLLSAGELVHECETEVVLFGGEIHGGEDTFVVFLFSSFFSDFQGRQVAVP